MAGWTQAATGTKTPTVAGTCTISNASPGVITMTNTCAAGDMVVFSTTGALPTGLTAGTRYYVISAGLSGSVFEVSATAGGSAINTSSAGSGTHTATIEHVLSSPSSSATYVLKVDTSALALGDLVTVRGYDKVDGTTYQQEWGASFQHTQIRNSKPSPFMAVFTGAQFTISQLSGTARAFAWEVLSQ